MAVVTWAAWPFHQAALCNARHVTSSMDTLVSLGILAACGWSAYAMFVLDTGPDRLSGLANLLRGSGGGIYLEVAASVTTSLLAGRLYEARARQTAGQARRDLAAASARDVCVLADDGSEQQIPASALRAGQRFVVRPGERIAADGQVEADRLPWVGDAASGHCRTTWASGPRNPVTLRVSRLIRARPPASIPVLRRARTRSPIPAWLPSASAACLGPTVPSWASLACTRRGSSAASMLDPASSSTLLPRR